MTTRYVRKTGTDTGAGTTPGTAWLTVGYAVGGSSALAAGDTIYVGAGVYRETIGTMKVVGSTTSLIGDTDGSQTGDAGEIVITAFTTNDTTAPAAAPTFTEGAGAFDNWTFQRLTIIGGNKGGSQASCIYASGQPHNLTLRDCTFWGDQNTLYAVFLDNYNPSSGAAHVLIERCRIFSVFAGLYYGQLSFSGSGDVDLDIVTRNCIIWGLTYEAARVEDAGVRIGGGFVFKNNLFIGSNRSGSVSQGWGLYNGVVSTTFPTLVYNNIFLGCGIAAQATNQILEDYNVIIANTTRSNVTAGTHSISNGSYDAHLLFGQEQTYGATLRPFGMPPAGSPLLGFGSFDSSVTDDLLQGIRPGSGIGSVSRSIGPFERANSATKNTSTLYSTIPQSVQINGPGYQDFQLPVPHGNVNVAIQARFDGTYTGTLPQMKVLNGGECGVSDATATTTGSANTWTQISLSFNTTAVGIVTIRLQSNDTAGAGKAFFAYAVVT